MTKDIKIGKKVIGESRKPFVIAEAGVNHNGRLDLALKLIDYAKEAGADAIKFQTFKAEQVVTRVGVMADYQKKNLGKNESQIEMLRKLELKEEFYVELIKRCKEKDILFISTPHGGFESVDFLNKSGVPAFKFGSGEITNLPVLEYAAKFQKPLIIGTGMSTLVEVEEAWQCIKNTGNQKVIFLHCTSDYPCPLVDVNLRAMQTMMQKLPTLVGYSDHTTGSQTAVMAVTLGAVLVEKHFTLDKNMPGPDHKASMEFEELKDLVESLKKVHIIMGSAIKKPTKAELKTIKIVRKSLVALRDIKKGEKFTKENVGIKRPGTGLSPKNYFKILGQKAKMDIRADSLIKN